MNVQNLKVSDLLEYEFNNKIHTPEQIDKIAASISQFGFLNPILLDTRKNIIAGHGRLLAAKKLKLAEVPCISVDHLTPEQVRLYRILDNKLSAESAWDFNNLELEIGNLEDLGLDINQWDLRSMFPSAEVSLSSESEESGQTDTDTRATCPECGHRFEPKDA